MGKVDFTNEKEAFEYIKNTTLEDIRAGVAESVTELNTSDQKDLAGALLSMYMSKLQFEYRGVMPQIYSYDLLPIDKKTMKEIGFHYIESVFRQAGEVKNYQLYGGLAYTRFQPMDDKLWSDISKKTDTKYMVYEVETTDGKKSNIDVPIEYKNIVSNKIREFNEGKREIETICKSKSNNNMGCGTAIIICMVLLYTIHKAIY